MDRAAPDLHPGRPRLLTPRRLVLAAIAGAGLLAAWHLDLRPAMLLPDHRGGLDIAARFFGAALDPAFSHEDGPPGPGAEPFLLRAARAAAVTIKFAAAGVSLSVVFGLLLGFLGSSAWWERHGVGPAGRTCTAGCRCLCVVGPVIYAGTRCFIAFTRSIHELIWAVIILAAFGLPPLGAAIALAIPYTGTFAKIFSEMIDETDPAAARQLTHTGASAPVAFLLGLLPAAVPDLISYIMYRFECGLRSAAVMGFLGIPTLGYYLKLSFENLHYREVWTYLYILVALVVSFDVWSGAIRRRLV